MRTIDKGKMVGRATSGLSTDEIMALTRGEDDILLDSNESGDSPSAEEQEQAQQMRKVQWRLMSAEW